MVSKILASTNNSRYCDSIFKYAIDFSLTFSAKINAVFVISEMIQNDIYGSE